MSHVSKMTTAMRNPKALVRALKRLGNKDKNIEVHEEAINCHGYHEEEKYKANIVLRRKLSDYSAKSSDVGWELQKDGTYAYHGDAFEYSGATVYNEDWHQKLETFYAIEAAKIEYEDRNIEYTEGVDEEKNPTLEARFPLEDEERFTA